MEYKELNLPSRTIMTPGPVEADPRVLRALSTPIIGQFDPQFLNIMDETSDLLHYVFQTENKRAFPVDGTSRSGIEAVLTSIIEPGDKVVVPVFGRFGYLLTEMVDRAGGETYLMEAEWGNVFDPQDVITKIKQVNPKVVAVVHGETSTGRLQPLKEIGEFCRENDILLVVDAVATLGGVEFKTDEWNVDAVITGTQKCLAVPTGMAPLTYNDRIERILLKRKKIERGLSMEAQNDRKIQSNYFDLSQIQDYWSPDRLNHHTESTTMLYALREGLRVIKEEGIENRIKRHTKHGKALSIGLKAMGVELFGEEQNKMPVVTIVKVPEGISEQAVRQIMLNEFGIEIAGAFGPLKGKVWRIGSMGYSSRKNNILHVLGALESTLTYFGVKVNKGDAAQAALEYYLEVDNPVVRTS
ncbi:aminotransferase class V-fold PLP-dependent enzyme [Virgibacillus dakarensis]|uniref:Purine catabolism protein PucG n=1 Tax=Lentibacillus populi TaxID=1827502 RepID=A0A9W5X538_9BACI|nr:alanine--glyoxylate aminotransferase family protein [Lentibacillus populi]MBT2218616.1 alanine--glyoxylate aminotransferase family protein [Virgibacillus dakarensis]MTW87467.1 aminotransferase class V-fold PLP-dependent enzyme [Virgibacillus dakarensis]GGB37452.1 purine catabolism protein PucG [Lentibacillus populi]